MAGAHVAVVNWRDLGHSLAGGSERYAWEYAAALRDAGATVDFVTAQEGGRPRRETVDGISIRRGGGPFTFYLFAAWFYLTRRRTLDVVIDPECGIPTFAPLFVRRSTVVVLVVHHVHQEQFRTYFPKPLAMLGRWLEAGLMPRVYRGVRTVAVSESTRDEMVDQLGWRGEIGILANGTADDAGQAGEPLAKDPDRLIALGRLVPHKRVDLVIRAVRDLSRTRPGLHLDVVGRGPEEGSLRELVAELDLTAHITIHGYLAEDEKAALLRRAALHVCASDIEGWGQVVIEAAAYGVPTVARDVPGLRDSIRDGSTGWLVTEHHDLTEQLRVALAELESGEARRQTFKACREWAGHFSWQRMHAEAITLVNEELNP